MLGEWKWYRNPSYKMYDAPLQEEDSADQQQAGKEGD